MTGGVVTLLVLVGVAVAWVETHAARADISRREFLLRRLAPKRAAARAAQPCQHPRRDRRRGLRWRDDLYVEQVWMCRCGHVTGKDG